MILHHLHEINLEYKVAFCSICGPTEIYVSKSREGKKPKVICLNRWQESLGRIRQTRQEKRQLQPGWKPRHSLSEIDAEKMTAFCSMCGPTQIRRRSGKRFTGYLCITKVRTSIRTYNRNAYSSRRSGSLAHVLSDIDEENKKAVCSRCGPVEIYIWQGKRKMGRRCSNASIKGVPGAQKVRREININLINKYKVEHGCKRCGYKSNINRLFLHSLNPGQKAPKIEKLLKLNYADLMRELEDCMVLCSDCRHLVKDRIGLDKLNLVSHY